MLPFTIRTGRGKEAGSKNSAASPPGKLPKWKQQSAQLRAAMLAAKPDKLGQAAAAVPGAVVVTDVSIQLHVVFTLS